MSSQVELWKKHPDYAGIEVSSFGRVRTLDRLISSETMTRFTKGRILKQYEDSDGYLRVSITADGKRVSKRVHRLVAQAFIPNPDNLPQINHKDCDRTNNNVSNLEWCSGLYNNQYRVKFGKSRGVPVFAINLKTQEVSQFPSQAEAGRVLGVKQTNISGVVNRRLKHAGGYRFTNANDNATNISETELKVSATSTNSVSQVTPNKSITPSIRMDEEEYQKLKALKEEYGVSWNELIKYANRMLAEDMKKLKN